MKAVFLDTDTFGKDVSFEPLKKLPLTWTFYPLTFEDEIANRLSNADIVVTNKVILSRKSLESSSLKLICIAATGTNHVDLKTAFEKKIPVCNLPSYSTFSVAQLTMTFILALSTSFFDYVEAIKRGLWQKHPIFCMLDFPLMELQGKMLGIIGYGEIGKEVAKIAKAFGMKISTLERKAKSLPNPLPLKKLLKEADFLTIHVPLTPETKNLIRERELSLMKPTSFLINVSRGGIVHEEDLSKALKEGKIAGAALDVLTEEPPPLNHPLLQKDVPHLLLTPHIAWGTQEGRKRAITLLAKNLELFLKGSFQNLVTRE